MTKKDKLLKQFLENPQSLKYKQIEHLLLGFDFKIKQGKGSHHLFFHAFFRIKLVIPVHNNDCKPIYKNRVKKLIQYYFQ